MKVTDAIRAKIIGDAAKGKWSQKEIGARYGVSQGCVSQVLRENRAPLPKPAPPLKGIIALAPLPPKAPPVIPEGMLAPEDVAALFEVPVSEVAPILRFFRIAPVDGAYRSDLVSFALSQRDLGRDLNRLRELAETLFPPMKPKWEAMK